MAFSTGVYEHPQFKLLFLLSEFYKGSSLNLSIYFLILNMRKSTQRWSNQSLTYSNIMVIIANLFTRKTKS
jgi:hypothetical protein